VDCEGGCVSVTITGKRENREVLARRVGHVCRACGKGGCVMCAGLVNGLPRCTWFFTRFFQTYDQL
jgi:hypothetical protein